MKRAIFLFTAIFVLAIAANAQRATPGTAIDNFSLPDTNGKVRSLNDLKGKNGVVIIFVSAQCPVVRGYNERMNQLAADYASKGITVIGINSNVTETAEQIKAHAEATYKFPVLIDKDSAIADKLGAASTPEAYFLDASNDILYHGAIDNDRAGTAVTKPYLRVAFDTALSGKPITQTQTQAFGCSIKRAGQ